MNDLVYELGFDWNMPSTESSLGIIYPLQMELLSGEALISPCNGAFIKTGDTLAFRVLDFTGSPPAPAGAEPRSLQVLFSGATNDPTDFSPILDDNKLQVPHLVTTEFHSSSDTTSPAYGTVARAWDVILDGGSTPSQLMLEDAGRFELRALLTVAASGQMAKFYRIDPEMVVDDGGP